MANYRKERLEEEIRRDIATLLVEGRIKDPLLNEGIITITSVELNRDFSTAKVFVSIYGQPANVVLKGMARAAGYIQFQLGKKLKLRQIPALKFVEDRSLAEGDAVNEILSE